jgi:formyl-CoA transferase
MKEIAEDEGLFATGTMVRVDHPERGEYLSVGCPIKLSDSPADVQRSPLLGEHTKEILVQVLGYGADDLDRIISSGAVGDVTREAAE